MPKVLLAEDEKALSDVVVDWLRSQMYMVDHVDDGREALDRLKLYEFDVVILDWNLPGMDGIQVCREFRAAGGRTPVIMLTGRREISDKEVGLDAGADDYLTKPFHMRELSARLRALLRRPVGVTDSRLKAGDLELDPASHRVFKLGQEVSLKPKEFALLEFLMRHPNEVFTSEALIERVWPTDSDASAGSVRLNINRIRKQIDTDGQPSFISTVHGVGYRFNF